MSDRTDRQEPVPQLVELEPDSLPCPLPRELLEGGDAGGVDLMALRLRLQELESENLALRTQVNRLIVSLSRTLMRDAAG